MSGSVENPTRMDMCLDCWQLYYLPARWVSPCLDSCYRTLCGRGLYKFGLLLIGVAVCIYSGFLLLANEDPDKRFGPRLGHVAFLCSKVLRDAYHEKGDCRTMPNVSNGKLVYVECTMHDEDVERVDGFGPFSHQSVQTLALRSEVEMLQCVQCTQNRFSIDDYRYRLEWHRAPVASHHFKNPKAAMAECGQNWENPEWPQDVPLGRTSQAAKVRLGRFTSDVLKLPTALEWPSTPVTEWSAPDGWSADVHTVVKNFSTLSLVESEGTCAQKPIRHHRNPDDRFDRDDDDMYNDYYDSRGSSLHRRRRSNFRPSAFSSRGWTYLGVKGRYCYSEENCGGEIPSCSPETNGWVIQDRRRYDGCIATQCGDSSSDFREYYVETYECHYHSNGPVLRDTFYSSRQVKNEDTALGMIRMRFYMTDFKEPTGEDPKEKAPSVEVIRIGQMNNGNIEKWTAPWPCSERYSQDKMYYVTEDRYRTRRVSGLSCYQRYWYDDIDNEDDFGYDYAYDPSLECLFMNSWEAWPYWRDSLQTPSYLFYYLLVYAGCILMSCTLPFLCSAPEHGRAPFQVGRSACLAFPLSLSLYSFLLGTIHLLIIGTSLIGLGGLVLGVVCMTISIFIGSRQNVVVKRIMVVGTAVDVRAPLINEPNEDPMQDEMQRLD